ncbi:hypothetical protein AGMMS49975_09000 [Clostridia bacterium]|nr:hypothetical protein AGMMS49975_09000 [Clostridia bacterium]
MTINKLKETLYERFTAYWCGATVKWGNASGVKPNAPLVVLRTGTVTRPPQPITQMSNGIVFSAYPSIVPLQVDLFTRGRQSEQNYYENTAESDLLDFVNFLDSVSSIEWSAKHNISVALISGVQDLSEVINDSQWQYRAMCEFSVAFTGWSAEYHGILNEENIVFDESGVPIDVTCDNWEQTASGGGNQSLANEKTGFFDEVNPEINKED